MYPESVLPKNARPSTWDEFTFDLGEDVTPEEAHAFARLLNRPEGQALLWKVAESLVQLLYREAQAWSPELDDDVVVLALRRR